jgi:transcription factor C subunit 3
MHRNLNAIGGTVPKETFQEAVGLEEVISRDDSWREWPFTASDGDCAVLLELVAENKVYIFLLRLHLY